MRVEDNRRGGKLKSEEKQTLLEERKNGGKQECRGEKRRSKNRSYRRRVKMRRGRRERNREKK